LVGLLLTGLTGTGLAVGDTDFVVVGSLDGTGTGLAVGDSDFTVEGSLDGF
jgi:hypothetical protein